MLLSLIIQSEMQKENIADEDKKAEKRKKKKEREKAAKVRVMLRP